MEKSPISNRIEELIKHLGISQTAFAKSLGTSGTRISNITQGRNKPDSQLLSAIAEVYPQVNAGWLLTGNGELDNTVKTSGTNTQEVFTDSANKNPYLNPTQTHIKPAKRWKKEEVIADLVAEHTQARNAKWFDYLLKDNKLFPGQAGSDAKQREWEQIDARLRIVVSNLLHIYEVTEDVLGIPFDDEAYQSLRAQSALPRLQRTEDGRYVNPVHEMEYDDRNRYYDSRNQLLAHCEAELSEAIRNLNIALSHPDLKRFSSTPRKGSVAELLISSGILAKRYNARYGEEPNE